MAKNSVKKIHTLAPKEVMPQHAPGGVRLLLDKSVDVDYSRLPMLEVVYDKFAELAVSAMRQYMADTVDIKMAGIARVSFGDYMRSCSNAVVSVFSAAALHNIGMIAIEGKLAHAMVDLLCGGRKAGSISALASSEARAFTPIEMSITRNIAEVLLRELGNSFEELARITFELERVEASHNVLTLLRPEDNLVALKLEVRCNQRSGYLTVLLPYVTLAPIKKLLSKSYTSSLNKDPAWAHHLETEIARSKVQMEVVLHGGEIAFSKVAELQIGQTVVLDRPSDAPCSLMLNGSTIGSVALGCIGDNIAVTMLSDGIKVISGRT